MNKHEKDWKNYVKGHLKGGGLVMEVTTKQVYAYPYAPNGWTPKQVIDEFFLNYDANACHASRDSAQVFGTKVITKVQLLNDRKKLPEFLKRKTKEGCHAKASKSIG